MRREFLRPTQSEVAPRQDHVGVDVVTVLADRAAERHEPGTPRIVAGPTISPATAAAAATQALARKIRESGWPILPRKFRFVVAIAVSPAARMPIWPPKHAPQVGGEIDPPAVEMMSSSPSLKAAR